jgi:molybdopterin synthase catalytic subunit
MELKHISAQPIQIAKLLEEAHNPEAGAVVLFSGEARNNHEGNFVDYLEYEAQIEMAEKKIEGIIKEAKARWDLKIAVAIHRVGKVKISDTAVVVITASAHREEAYEANRFIIDEIKSKAPIWKKEFLTDGRSIWQN